MGDARRPPRGGCIRQAEADSGRDASSVAPLSVDGGGEGASDDDEEEEVAAAADDDETRPRAPTVAAQAAMEELRQKARPWRNRAR